MESLSPHVRDYLLIEDLATDDRPREKAMRNGIRSLSKAELIAIIFGNGIKGKSVLTMSQELLANNHGRLSVIARKSIKEIIKGNPGIGPAKAIALAAAIELGIRCQEEAPQDKVRIIGSESVYSHIRGKLQRLNHEEFWIIMLSRSNHVVDTVCISQGGTSMTVVDPKILFKRVGTGRYRLVDYSCPQSSLRQFKTEQRGRYAYQENQGRRPSARHSGA